jgi:1,4-alpha-glucan branching enzyme
MIIRLFSLPLLFCLALAENTWAQSSRSGMGAVPYADAAGTGVTFRTWAPNASSVSIRGGFNAWGTTALAKDSSGGTWSVDIPRAKAGDEYKFVVNSAYKKDPRGKRVVNSAGNSIVYDSNAFSWGGSTNFSPIWRNDLVIYEMHVGSYNAEDWLPSTFDECAEKIAYWKALGISAVELMPVNEFPGDRSWGYNPSDPYAIESSFGGPDGFKRFVKACHENGIAVLMDVVHNHYGPSDLEMWQYDGWSQSGYGGIYFYNDWKANTDWGSTRPDYGRSEVKDYIQGQIQMFVEEYRVDGFRWDSVYNIRNCSGTWNPDGNAMLAQVNNWLIANHPDVFRIAEDHAFDTDVGFEAQWDHDFLSNIRWLATAAGDADRNMDTLAYFLGNGGFNRVTYVESHDTCGDLNSKHRLPYDIDSSNSTSYYAKKRALLANGIVLVSPGIPMIFEGSEMHESWTFSNNQALRWSLTNTYAGIVKAYADLIHLRRNTAGISAGLKEAGKVNVFHVNNTAKIVGLTRWNNGSQTDDLVIALNCSATAQASYSLAFPSAGTWYCLYNSDSKTYDSSFGGVGPAIGDSIVAGASATLALGAYSIQIYSKSRLPGTSAATFDPAAPSGCGSTVNVTYAPADGPLKDATNVYAYIGRNNWQWPSNVQMTASNGAWTLAYPIPDDTYELDLSFTDGGTLWDNNAGANWAVAVSNCGDLPAIVTLTPASPQGCIPVQVAYEANGGPLMGATQIHLYIGRNGWKNITEIPLALAGGDTWTGTYAIPDDTWQVDFVFHDESNRWDNNSTKDWHVLVSGCVNMEQPYIAITNPAPNTTVPGSTAQQSLQGVANLLAGQFVWTNTLNHESGTIAYATNWGTVTPVPLAEGVNVIRVSGTNSSVNPNHGAQDSPADAVYAQAAAWTNGMNGGQLFKPWIITGNSAAWAASNTQGGALSLGTNAWALQADNGGFVQAIRPFSAPLLPGDKVSFAFENGGIDGSPSSVGVAFQNRFDQRLTEIYFEGGATNFVINDLALRNTGIPWSNTPKTCTLEMLTELTYRFTINGQPFEGELAEKSELLISRIRFWNYNAGTNNERRFYVGALSVTGAPLPVLSYSSEIAVTRAASTNAPPRQTLSWLASGDGSFVATVDNPAGLDGNIFAADALDSEGGWNWTNLPNSDYTISNNSVILAPSGTGVFQIISIGKPGGL